jgi:DNA adenine methylase
LAASHVLKAAEIQCCDFELTLADVCRGDRVYADPPYVLHEYDAPFGRYVSTPFTWNDQARLASSLASLGKRGAIIAVSGPDDKRFCSLYPGWSTVRVGRYSCLSKDPSQRKAVTELVVTNVDKKLFLSWSRAFRMD